MSDKCLGQHKQTHFCLIFHPSGTSPFIKAILKGVWEHIHLGSAHSAEHRDQGPRPGRKSRMDDRTVVLAAPNRKRNQNGNDAIDNNHTAQ